MTLLELKCKLWPRTPGKLGRTQKSEVALGHWHDYLTAPLAPAPQNWTSPRPGTPQIGMLGNDEYGDCVFAGIAHTAIFNAKFLGEKVAFTTTEVVNAYFKFTGGKDVGADIGQALYTWCQPGFFAGKAVGAARINQADLTEVRQVIANYGAVVIGVNLQQAQEDQFSAGQPWQFVEGSPVLGGHCVVLTGYDEEFASVVTWGKRIQASWSCLSNICDEAYVVVTPEIAEVKKYVLDVASLEADMAALAPPQ